MKWFCFAIAMLLFTVSPTHGETTPVEANAPANRSDQTYLLKYKFIPNQFVHYQVNFTSQISNRSGEYEQLSRNQTSTRRHYRVISADKDGTAELELILDYVKMKSQFNKEDPVIIDSANKDDPSERQYPIFNQVGKPLTRVKMSSQGKLIQTTKLSTAVQSNDESMNFLLRFPEHKISVGDHWKEIYEIDVPMDKTLKQKIKFRRKYTLTSVKNGIAFINLETAALTPLHNPNLKARVIQQAPKGTIQFDLKRGLLLSRTSSVNQTVIGAMGPSTSMSVASTSIEKLHEHPVTALNKNTKQKRN